MYTERRQTSMDGVTIVETRQNRGMYGIRDRTSTTTLAESSSLAPSVLSRIALRQSDTILQSPYVNLSISNGTGSFSLSQCTS